MDQTNLNFRGQDCQSEALSSGIPPNYDGLQEKLQTVLMKIKALERNLTVECQTRQQVEEAAAYHLQQAQALTSG